MAERRDTDRLQEEIEELFADLWQVPRFASRRGVGFRPQVDCYRTEEPPQLTIVVELAGVDPASIQLAAGERELVIAGERTRPPGRARVYQQLEIEYGAFERRIALREPVDLEAAAASYDAGMLTITLPIATPPVRVERVTIAVRRR